MTDYIFFGWTVFKMTSSLSAWTVTLFWTNLGVCWYLHTTNDHIPPSACLLCKIRMPANYITLCQRNLLDSVECLREKKLLKRGSIFCFVLPKGSFNSSTHLSPADVRTGSTSSTATDLRPVGMCNMSQDHSLYRGLVFLLSPSPFFSDLLWFWAHNKSIV